MNVNQIKPSDLKSWDIVKMDPKSQSLAAKSLVDPGTFSYYKGEDGKWYPHRKATVTEIVNNEFKRNF